MQKYILKMSDNNCISLSKPLSTGLAYKIPYHLLKEKSHGVIIPNRFIVYILVGKEFINTGNANKIIRNSIIYVGKSKNGIDARPLSHEDKIGKTKDGKNSYWHTCYVLTDLKEGTILNDGTIQYIEDKICKRINDLSRFTNTTTQTTSGTANHSDMEDCDIYLREAYQMLYALGLDLLNSDHIFYGKGDEEGKENGLNLDSGIAAGSCRKHEVPENLKSLYESTCKMFKSSFPGLKVVNKPSTINFMYGKLIVGSVVAQSRTLKLYFNLPGHTMEDPNKLLENCGKIGHHGVGNYRITFADKENFDDIKDFMVQCRRYYK